MTSCDVEAAINRKYNLKTLIDCVRRYPVLSNARRVTWEYVMIKGVNDTPEDAKALVKLIKGYLKNQLNSLQQMAGHRV